MVFYNFKLNLFEEISTENKNKSLEELSKEKQEINKTLDLCGNKIIFDYFPEFIPYSKNYPYLIKMIINKIKEESENLKKANKNKKNNPNTDNTFSQKTEISYKNPSINQSSSKSSDKNSNQSEYIYLVGKNKIFSLLFFNFLQKDLINICR